MKCLNCGRDFELNRMWQKFCCEQCQQRWNYIQRRESNGNGNVQEHDDAYREKWAAIRAEWAREDHEEQQSRRRFVRRI